MCPKLRILGNGLTDALPAAAPKWQIRKILGDLRGDGQIDRETIGVEFIGPIPKRR